MKKFAFRLQPVLDLRLMQEEQKKRRVGLLQGEINARQQEALDDAGLIRQEGEVLRRQLGAGAVDRRQVGYYQGYVTAMRKRIAQRIERVREIQKDLLVARAELAAAARQTKVMEKLKERQKQRHDHELKLIETRQSDEMGQMLYLRNRALTGSEG